MHSKYAEIINLPHHVSPNRRPMSLYDRAAQFAPFAALDGHDEALEETARITSERIELSDYEQQELTRKLTEAMTNGAEITISYFLADPFKAGGTYRTVHGAVKKLDNYSTTLTLMDGTVIPLVDIRAINCEG